MVFLDQKYVKVQYIIFSDWNGYHLLQEIRKKQQIRVAFGTFLNVPCRGKQNRDTPERILRWWQTGTNFSSKFCNPEYKISANKMRSHMQTASNLESLPKLSKMAIFFLKFRSRSKVMISSDCFASKTYVYMQTFIFYDTHLMRYRHLPNYAESGK